MKTNIFLCVISLLLICSCQKENLGKIVNKGTGTEANPYLIYTVADLETMRDHVNQENAIYGNKCYKLMADLDLSGDTSTWTPIGQTSEIIVYADSTAGPTFNGIFDGNGKVIKNIHIGTSARPIPAYSAGLFGYVYGGTIKNLSVQWTCLNTKEATNASCPTGGICGYISGNGQITNCYSSGTLQGDFVGGICGQMNSGQITNCHFTGNITTSVAGGGIVGEMYGQSITNCYSQGNITCLGSNTSAGGIGGYISAAVTNCYSTDSITGSGCWEGGIGGSIDAANIINCYSTGTITSNNVNSQVGGIAGYAWYVPVISNCYSTGDITGVNYVGGITGNNDHSPITNCYASGNIIGTINYDDTYVGGISGLSYYSTINNCIALNRNIELESSGLINRISNFDSGTGNNNYASASMTVKRGSAVMTNFTDTISSGIPLNANPVDLLNLYVSAHPIANNIHLLTWEVINGTNNGYPVFQQQ